MKTYKSKAQNPTQNAQNMAQHFAIQKIFLCLLCKFIRSELHNMLTTSFSIKVTLQNIHGSITVSTAQKMKIAETQI